MQAEQSMRAGRMSPLPSQRENVQIFRVTPNNTAPAAGRGSRQSGAGVTQDKAGFGSDSDVYREAPGDPAPGQGGAGAATGSTEGSSQPAGPGTANTTGMARMVGAGSRSGTNASANTGKAEAASAPVRSKAPDSYEKQLKLNFNEDNLLSGIIMAEVLGKPKCLRRGRW